MKTKITNPIFKGEEKIEESDIKWKRERGRVDKSQER